MGGTGFEQANRLVDDVLPVDAQHREPVVGTERREVLVARPLNQLGDSEVELEVRLLLLHGAAQLRRQEPCATPWWRRHVTSHDRRDGENVPAFLHPLPPLGASTIVMLRPSKLSPPSRWPTSCRSAVSRASSSRPSSGRSRSRPRRRTTSFTFERARRNSTAWFSFQP